MLGSLDRKRPLVAKALRITLVFLLVFWSSFSVQSLVAFGSEDSGSPAPGSTLTSADYDDPLEGPGDSTGDGGEIEKTFVSVQVVWDDSGDEAGDRPVGVTARLLANGEETGDTLYVTASRSWQGLFEGLDATDENGVLIDYSVSFDEVGGYEDPMVETDGGNGFIATFVRTPSVDEDDFYVQLAFTPPPAGEMAIFTASVNLAGRTVSEYVWEYSQDGGLTWNVIPGEKSASFSVKTEPVSDEPSDDGEDPEPVVLTYVRVRVIATSGEVAVSNAQPLTVEVGGSGHVLPNMLIRLGGKTRYDTMKAIVEEAFPRTCKHVVLVSGANFPDALSAAALAGAYDCPVVTTKPNALSTQARAEIERLGAKSIIIVGGTSAVSKAVETTVKGLNGGTKVERISGSTRYDTALKVMNRVASLYPVDTVFIATGKNFPDALAVSPYSYAHGAPIVLVDPAKGMTNAQANAVVATGAKRAVLLGGKNVVPDSVAMKLFSRGVNEITRLAGSTRYATSIEIAKWATRNGSNLWRPVVTTGLKDADALVGAALAGRNDSVLLLADDKSGKDKATAVPALSFLANHVGEVDICYILGGENAVSRTMAERILAATDGEVYSYPDESAILPAEPTLPTSLASAADDKRFTAAAIG